MNRQYPRTKFADTNHIWKQMWHVQAEIEEFNMAASLYKQGATATPNHLILEAHDIIQSAYTLMDILEREYPGQAWSALEEMIRKNDARGYYGEGK